MHVLPVPAAAAHEAQGTELSSLDRRREGDDESRQHAVGGGVGGAARGGGRGGSGRDGGQATTGDAGGGKPKLHMVVVGHVDAGKSTLMGRLLFELGCVPDRLTAFCTS